MSAPVYTTAQYQALCAAISKGALSLDNGNGEKVVYRSLDEMLRLKATMERDLGLNALPRHHYPRFRRG